MNSHRAPRLSSLHARSGVLFPTPRRPLYSLAILAQWTPYCLLNNIGHKCWSVARAVFVYSGTSDRPPGEWRYMERSSRCGLVSRSSFRCVRNPAGPRQQDPSTRGDRTRIRHDTWAKRATHEEHLDRTSEDILAAAGSMAIDSALRKRSHQSCAAGDTIGVKVESSFRCQAEHKIMLAEALTRNLSQFF